MQKQLKYTAFAFFTLFLSYISNADTAHQLYILDKSNNSIYACNIRTATNVICGTPLQLDNVQQPNAIVISPQGYIAYITTAQNKLYMCFRSTDTTGRLFNCEDSGYQFSEPAGMGVDNHGNVYVANKGNGTITACSAAHSLDGKLQCWYAGMGFTAPNDIAISPDGTYAYITQPEAGYGYVAICPILVNQYDNVIFGTCDQFNNNLQFVKPTAVTVDPLSKFLYVINGASPQDGVSCPLSGNRISSYTVCPSYKAAYNYPSTATSITMTPQYSIMNNTAHAYISNQAQVFHCKIQAGQYSCLDATSKPFRYITSIAYAIGIESFAH